VYVYNWAALTHSLNTRKLKKMKFQASEASRDASLQGNIAFFERQHSQTNLGFDDAEITNVARNP